MSKFLLNNKKNQIIKLLILLSLCVYGLIGVYWVASVTSLYMVSGDDIVNLSDYWALANGKSAIYVIFHFFQQAIKEMGNVSGRYFPIAVANAYLVAPFCGSVILYRSYIAAITFLDIGILGLLIYRIEKRSDIAVLFSLIAPFLLNLNIANGVWHDGNALYSYAPIVHMTLFWGFLALHFELSYIRSDKKKLWGILSACMTLCGCLTYECGYLFVFVYIFLSVAYGDKAKRWWSNLLYSVPNVIAIVVSFILYVIALLNAGEVHGDLKTELNISKIVISTAQEMSAALPINTSLYMGKTIDLNMLSIEDVLYPLIGAVAIIVVLLFYISNSNHKAIIKGMMFSLLVAIPSAGLISLTAKFQYGGSYVSWGGGWIVCLICTFGFMIGAAYLVIWIIGFVENNKVIKMIMAMIIGLIVVMVGSYNHFTTRVGASEYSSYGYDMFTESISKGGFSENTLEKRIVSNYTLWLGDDHYVDKMFEAFSALPVEAVYLSDKDMIQKGDIIHNYYTRLDGKDLFIYNDRFAYVVQGEYEGRKDGKDVISDVKVFLDVDSLEMGEELNYLNVDQEGKVSSVAVAFNEIVDYSGDSRFYVDLPGLVVLDSVEFGTNKIY